MLPTLNGRIQTRLFMLATWGVFWTLVLTPLLLEASGAAYRVTFILLATVAVLGVLWELVYHGLMQWRWEKDWPTFFGFITCINEGALIILLLKLNLVPGLGFDSEYVPVGDFLVLFLVIWMTIFVWTNGPMRIFNIHWRFFGGRIV
ncbi:hypothetical protein GCM10023340_39700 [Nocardioides marinquilinus]|uniref:Uncharacterized protein n=1 Tax=Nocardioides marinquilinus TaxID=1210400 RepID=A0ABP9Q0D2_9ACTN